MKQTLMWFNLQRDGSGNGYFCRNFVATNISSASKRVFKAGLSSSYDRWAKCKEIVADVLDPNQNVQTTCNSKFKFT